MIRFPVIIAPKSVIHKKDRKAAVFCFMQIT